MNKILVKVAMGFTLGFLFCLLFGTIGLGVNTWIDHNKSATKVEASEGDTVSIYSDVDIAVVTFFTKDGMAMSYNNQEISFPAGTTNIQLEPGEYFVSLGKGTVSTHFGDTVFNIDDFFRKMKMKKIITIASLLSGFVIGFLISLILDEEEKPRQKFIGE